MEETRNKTVLVKPIEGMTQFQEALSVKDSEFRLLSGVFPKEAGIQARMLGKVLINKFASGVLSIFDFLGTRLIQTLSDGLVQEKPDGTFATLQIAASTQSKNRDCFAASPNVQLCVRSNGEERTKVIDKEGNIFDAEIPQPTAAPTASPVAGGTLTPLKSYAYAYVYAATTAYPFVANTISINGKICPRGNPSPATTATTTNVNKTINIGGIVASPRADVDKVWIFRSTAYGTLAEAQNAGAAGLLYFIAEQAASLTTFSDNGIADGVDQIENDNYKASSFKNVVYFDPYWIGFGADVMVAQVTWTTGTWTIGTPTVGLITLTNAADIFYLGRANQPFKLSGITTGGIDGKGTFYLYRKSATTAIPGATPDGLSSAYALPAMGAGTQYITVSPPTANIYRSKAYNPFAWGWTRVIGTTIESLEWTLKLGGGNGTAITIVPTESILKVDTEFPTRSSAFNLQLIDNFDQFKQTQKLISETLSISNQHSQFYAQDERGQTVLWGMDYKSFAILQSNGITQNIISFPVQNILRTLTTTKADQVFAHGIYDPRTQCNCMWVTLVNSPSTVHYLIYQHAPTGYWGVMEDLDILSSARIQDSITGQVQIRLGTSTGIYGKGFVDSIYQNWVQSPDPTTVTITSATTSSITASASTFDANALKGVWVLITDSNDQNEQWARVSAIATHALTFDRTYVNGQRFATLQTTPQAGWKAYIGLIECRALKFFDFKAPNTDKKFQEIWISQENTTSAQPTLVRMYREWTTTLLSQFKPIRDSYKDGTPSTSFIEKRPPAEVIKSFSLELINREYSQWILRNMVLKYEIVP